MHVLYQYVSTVAYVYVHFDSSHIIIIATL